MDALRAAVRCGATAVYLGGNTLNARKHAQNFDHDALKQAVEYCHARGVAVHFALNTLVNERELGDAAAAIEEAAGLGVDALILQDLGVFAMAKSMAPGLELHASTQLSIHTPGGVKLLETLGFHRAVLAREMNREEIGACRSASPLPLEVFVHGALCMCVSGQCYLSAMLGSRSGNRGLCAQPCRLPFHVKQEGNHDLSLKDLTLMDKAKELAALGISSLKIEGRMKRPEYVAAAVTACRQALEDGVEPTLQDQLRSVFSRSGFTDGYYTGHVDSSMFGFRQKEDVVSAAPVLKQLSRLYDRETPLLPCDFALSVTAGEKIALSARAGGKCVFVQEDVLAEPAVNHPLTKEALKERIAKCGGTPFYAREIDIDLEEGLSVPASALNALRRKALDELLAQLGEPSPPAIQPVSPALRDYRALKHKEAPPFFTARFADASQAPQDLSALHDLYVPLETPFVELKALTKRHPRVGVELPRGMFGKEDVIKKQLETARDAGIRIALCGNLGGVQLAQQAKMEIHGDFGLNSMNSYALHTLESLGAARTVLSMELTLQQAADIGGTLPRGLLVYGRLPLMLTRNCPVKAQTSCKDCGGAGSITDRMGIRFPIRCRMGCSELYNSRPLYLGDRLRECKGVDFYQLYFTIETQKDCESILSAYHRGLPPEGEFTRGLAYRGVE